MPEPVELVRVLDKSLTTTRAKIDRLDRYYEGEQPLRYMAPALEAEVGDRITQLVINWPRKGVDTYDHRLDIEGFRYRKQESGDETMWEMWQDNDDGEGPAADQGLEVRLL